MRLFIAIDFSAETRAALHDLTLALRACARGGTFVPAANLHLTLAFLGECDGTEMNAACDALDRVTFAPFDLGIDTLGCFAGKVPGRRGKRGAYSGSDTWWAGVAANAELGELHTRLLRELTAAGLSPERRSFKPHVTLGRRVTLPPTGLDPALTATGIHITEHVEHIHLMRSERPVDHPVYTTLHSTR
jgi:2'-5' RNA ligase